MWRFFLQCLAIGPTNAMMNRHFKPGLLTPLTVLAAPYKTLSHSRMIHSWYSHLDHNMHKQDPKIMSKNYDEKIYSETSEYDWNYIRNCNHRIYLGIYWYDIQNNIGKDILSCFVVGNLIAEYVVTEMNIEQHIVRNLGVMNR